MNIFKCKSVNSPCARAYGVSPLPSPKTHTVCAYVEVIKFDKKMCMYLKDSAARHKRSQLTLLLEHQTGIHKLNVVGSSPSWRYIFEI